MNRASFEKPWADALIIPDVHQNLRWLETVLGLGKDCEGLIFLGDYLDPATDDPGLASPAETLDFLENVAVEWQERAVFLLGNHDLHYLESMRYIARSQAPEPRLYGCGASWSGEIANQVAEKKDLTLFKRLQLFATCQGHLISHAGVDRTFWKKRGEAADALRSLAVQADYALSHIDTLALPILGAGKARGGNYPCGGLTWLDWEREFEDALPLPQIVGHSRDPKGARQKGRSWCIDGGQTVFGRLVDNRISIEHL